MKRGLGRGLSALIPGASEESGSALLEIPVSAIAPNSKQPRSTFDDEALDGLVASIREVGLLQPVVVRSSGDSGYELIAGERRLRAARKLGLATIPAVIRESDDLSSLQEALMENIHRTDLGPMELAEAYRELLEELGATQEVVARHLGVSRSSVANTVRLLQLPTEVQLMVSEGRLQAGHARALVALEDPEAQAALGLRIAAEELSVREAEQLVRRYLALPDQSKAKKTTKDATKAALDTSPMAEVEEILSEQLATRVTIQMGARRRGKIVVEFGSPDDLERIVSEIVGSGPGLAP
jgi:ParB family chromosome partitioning protein